MPPNKGSGMGLNAFLAIKIFSELFQIKTMPPLGHVS